VVCWARWDVSKEDSIKSSYINAEFHGCSRGKDVSNPVLEKPLASLVLTRAKLRGMLFAPKTHLKDP
jgi:hypothetical protein